MKKILTTTIVILFSVLYTVGSFANGIDISGDFPKIENISTVKLYTPATVKFIDDPNDSPFFNIRTKKYLRNYIQYEINDSTLEIKLKHGNYNDFDLKDNDIQVFIAGNNSIKIVPANDLVISSIKKYEVLNHENKN